MPSTTSYVDGSGGVADETTTETVRASGLTFAVTNDPSWRTWTGASVVGMGDGECQVSR